MILASDEQTKSDHGDEAAIEAGLAETVRLAAMRGETMEQAPRKRGEARKPIRRVDGLTWLWNKKKLTIPQRLAGERYGEDWRIGEEQSIRSCLDIKIRGGLPGEGPEARRLRAKRRLELAREQALAGQGKLIGLCDLVCGQGISVTELASGGWRQVVAHEENLFTALDLLARHYRLDG